MHVSIMVANHTRNYECVMKVKEFIGNSEVRSAASRGSSVHHQPTWIFLKGLSRNMSVGTRKMVNFA